MTLTEKYTEFDTTLCGAATAISMSLVTDININVTTCRAITSQAILNEDNVTAILTETDSPILSE
jgi:Tat protein secretion system quality control protein TatD with DNase activity